MVVSSVVVSDVLVSVVSDVASSEAAVSDDVTVPELESPVNEDLNIIEVDERSASTTPLNVKDVDSPDESGAKYIVVLLSIVEATISIPDASLKSSKS